jgi:multiple sugar transport system substrate-binding protein
MSSTPTQGPSRRRFLQASGALGLGAALAACGAGGHSASSKTSGGKATGTLNVLCESGGHAELTKVSQAFTQQTGNRVNFIELPYDGLFNRLSSELSSGSLSFQVAAIDEVWLPGFAGRLQPLDDLFTSDVKNDLFPSTLAAAQIDGKYLGMPAWTNAEIVFYRTDLFNDPNNQAKFKQRFGYPLAAPTNWKQFQDAAQFFTGKGIYGTDVKGAVETEWLAHILQAGSPGVVLDDSGNVIIDNDQHIAALAFYSDLNNKYHVAPSGAAQVDWAAAQNLFNQGKLAMTRFWAHAFPLIPKDSPVYGKVSPAPMIAGSAGIAGIPGPYYLSLPTKGSANELGTQYIKFVYDNNAMCIQSSLGLAARKSVIQDYSSKPGYEHFKALLTTLNAPATKNRPNNTKWQEIVDKVLVPTLQKSLTGGADYAGLLKNAKSNVEQLLG